MSEMDTGRGRFVRTFDAAPRWPYVFPAAMALLFVGHAAEDAGAAGAAMYVGIIAVSLIQAIRRTVVGWLILFAPFLAYGGVVAASRENGPFGEWLLFMALGFGPALALWLGRPWRYQRSRKIEQANGERGGTALEGDRGRPARG